MLQTLRRLDFHTPTLEDAAWAGPLLRQRGVKGCEFCYATIFMWRQYYDNQIAYADDIFFSRSGSSSPLYMMPVTPEGRLREAIEALREYSRDRGETLRLFGAGEEDRRQIDGWFPGVFDWMKSPSDYDYIYHTEDLATLPGKKYHGKRGHVVAFSREYDWEYEPIGPHNAEDVLDMLSAWCRERGNCVEPSLRYEDCAIREAVANMEALSLRGGTIRVKTDGRIAALTLGSPVSAEMFDIHVEKALTSYKGAYAAINKEFAERELLGRYRYINRENDLGLEGLRKAKLSYHPAEILEKYIGEEKPL